MHATPHFLLSPYVLLDFSLKMAPMWSRPTADFVKINVHAVIYNPPLPNGNTTGVGIVIRDDEGFILAIISGTLGHINTRANELWAI